MKKRILTIATGVIACATLLTIGSYQQFTKAAESEEPVIYTEVSHYDTIYNFSDSDILAEHSDLIVVGKLTELGNATNYNPITKKYGKACTPGTLEILEVVKSDGNENLEEIEFMDVGGTISYSDYEKSLLPAQKAKREYLMQQNGQGKSRRNVFVHQMVENQLELEEGKTYIMYLYYNENYGKYMVVNQPYGIKEYNETTHEVRNHVTNEVANLQDLM